MLSEPQKAWHLTNQPKSGCTYEPRSSGKLGWQLVRSNSLGRFTILPDSVQDGSAMRTVYHRIQNFHSPSQSEGKGCCTKNEKMKGTFQGLDSVRALMESSGQFLFCLNCFSLLWLQPIPQRSRGEWNHWEGPKTIQQWPKKIKKSLYRMDRKNSQIPFWRQRAWVARARDWASGLLCFVQLCHWLMWSWLSCWATQTQFSAL